MGRGPSVAVTVNCGQSPLATVGERAADGSVHAAFAVEPTTSRNLPVRRSMGNSSVNTTSHRTFRMCFCARISCHLCGCPAAAGSARPAFGSRGASPGRRDW